MNHCMNHKNALKMCGNHTISYHNLKRYEEMMGHTLVCMVPLIVSS